MKIIILAFACVLFSTAALADHVNGYYRSNGTYVAPYERSHSDGTVTNNYSYQGNTNPYNGSSGTNRYEHDITSPNYEGPDSHGNVGHSGYGRGYEDIENPD